MSDQEDDTQANSRSLITAIKRQRNCNKLYVTRILDESQSIIATNTQHDSNQSFKVKLTVNRNIFIKVTFIKSFGEKVVDAITTDKDMEKEIFESSKFERYVSEMIISIDIWFNSHEEEVMSYQTQPHPIQAPVSPVRPRLPKCHLFPVIPFSFKRFGTFE